MKPLLHEDEEYQVLWDFHTRFFRAELHDQGALWLASLPRRDRWRLLDLIEEKLKLRQADAHTRRGRKPDAQQSARCWQAAGEVLMRIHASPPAAEKAARTDVAAEFHISEHALKRAITARRKSRIGIAEELEIEAIPEEITDEDLYALMERHAVDNPSPMEDLFRQIREENVGKSPVDHVLEDIQKNIEIGAMDSPAHKLRK